MEALKKYKIDIADLSIGEREYKFDFSDDFFSNFEHSIITNGNGEIKAVLNKNETFIELSLHILGKIILICDRSLNQFDFPININRKLIIKFGEEPENNDEDDIMFINWNTPSINIAHILYEFISMEIPMKKLHPRYKEVDDNDELIYSSEGIQNEPADPRWSKLNELKKDNKN